MVPRVDLLCVVMAFPGHTYLLFGLKSREMEIVIVLLVLNFVGK